MSEDQDVKESVKKVRESFGDDVANAMAEIIQAVKESDKNLELELRVTELPEEDETGEK